MDRSGRTIIASVVFTDIVRYSQASDSRQIQMKRVLDGYLRDAVRHILRDELIILDTGDGAAVSFLGDPEDALYAATAVRDQVVRHEGDGAHSLRTGINLGPVRVVTDLNGRTNMLGDGINVAQRVMSFADEGEILVSRSFYEVVSRLNDGNETLFSYLGVKQDKHVREHQVYTYSGSPGSRPTPEDGIYPVDEPVVEIPVSGSGNTVTRALLSAEALAAEETRLARMIGPLARVIVRRASESAADLDAFYHIIAGAIPDEADRSAFLARTRPVADTPSAPVEPRRRAPTAPARAAFAPSEDYLARTRNLLAQEIGPLSRILVEQARQDARSREDFIERLAAHVPEADRRAAFVKALRAGSDI